MSYEYELEIFSGHMLVEINGNTYLIDTGSPATISNQDNLHLTDKVHDNLPNNFMGISVESIGKLLGKKITGLIGADILSEYTVTFDLKQNIIIFNREVVTYQGNFVNFESIWGIPLVNAVIRNAPVKLFVDTGAQLSYLNEKLTENDTPQGAFQDFHPLMGAYTTETYRIPVKIGQNEIEPLWGNLPELLKLSLGMGRADGVLGYALFKDRVVTIDYKSGIISL